MRKAYNTLTNKTKSDSENFDNTSISATHYYVMFTPRDENDLSKLKTDSTLVLFQTPLDLEILPYDNFYSENTTANTTRPCPLFASVPVNKNLSNLNVPHKILEELFIPDDGTFLETKGGSVYTEEFIEALVNKSLELTGNLDSEYSDTKANTDWHPQGNITYYDDVLGAKLPIEGLQISAHDGLQHTRHIRIKTEIFIAKTLLKDLPIILLYLSDTILRFETKGLLPQNTMVQRHPVHGL